MAIAGGVRVARFTALSTAAGLLLSISSAISHDLLKGMTALDISEKKELLARRFAMAGAIGVAGYLGMNPPGFATQVVALAFGLAASSLFPALMLGIFDKRMKRTGAIAGMLTGVTSTVMYIVWFKGWFYRVFRQHPGKLVHGHIDRGLRCRGRLAELHRGDHRIPYDCCPAARHKATIEDIRVPRGAGAATGH
jgi:cation/acetate symporter